MGVVNEVIRRKLVDLYSCKYCQLSFKIAIITLLGEVLAIIDILHAGMVLAKSIPWFHTFWVRKLIKIMGTISPIFLVIELYYRASAPDPSLCTNGYIRCLGLLLCMLCTIVAKVKKAINCYFC